MAGSPILGEKNFSSAGNFGTENPVSPHLTGHWFNPESNQTLALENDSYIICTVEGMH